MGIYNNLMDQLADKGALFNVSTDTLLTGAGTTVPNKKCIINNHNGKVIGLVSEKYKVVPNEAVFDAFCKSVEASDIDYSDAQVNVSFANGGSKTLVDFVFPNENVGVYGDDSHTSLSITSLNSFDGSTRFLTKAGGLRMKCLNGQLIGSITASYSSIHSDKLDIERGADQIVRMLQEFRGAKDYWNSMMQTKVTPSIAQRVIIEFFNKQDAEDPFKSRDVEVMWQMWRQYSSEMGSNAYALYNAFTDWVSHKESKSAASGRLTRERRLQKLLAKDIVFQPANQQMALAA